MPQKAKFTREEIIKQAVILVEEKGIEFLTARALGERLGSSARPIFTIFKNMDEVISAVYDYANEIYQNYISDGLSDTLAFKGVGTMYIRFASEHSKLFQLLFMKEQNVVPKSSEVLGLIEDSYQKILDSITKNYNVSEEFAKELYFNLWVYSHGIAVLITTKMCKFSDEEISNKLTEIFKSLIKSGVKND